MRGARTLRYADLDARSAGVAAGLAARGILPGTRLAVAVGDDLDAAVALLGAWRAGAVAVPLDAADPAARRAAHLRVSGATAALLDDDADDDLDDALRGLTRLAWRDLRAAAGPAPALPPPGPDDEGLVVFAPGADGAPRAIALTHTGLAHSVMSAAERLGLHPGDTVALRPDASLVERLLPLGAGARAVLLDEDDAESGADLARALAGCGASLLCAPRATWRQLAAAGFAPVAPFRALAIEPLPAELASDVAARVGSLWSAWGVEEAGLLVALDRHALSEPRPLLPAPLPGVRLRLLDGAGQPAPEGVPGEVCVGGPGVAPALRGPDGLVRTGQLARRLAGGRVQLLERGDGRLTLRGRRAEADEIRAALRSHTALAEAEVGLRDDPQGEPRLVAWIVRRPGADVTDSDLRRHLRRALPDALVPQRFVELEALPRAQGGRPDARRLVSPFRPAAAEARPPQSTEEILLAELWSELLGLPRVSVLDNFFELGGHSLLALRLVARVEARTGKRLKPRLLLLGSLEQAAAELQRLGAGA